MTSNMTKLQKMVKDEGLKNVELVSFSVDPGVDTPEVLTRYASNSKLILKIGFSDWLFPGVY